MAFSCRIGLFYGVCLTCLVEVPAAVVKYAVDPVAHLEMQSSVQNQSVDPAASLEMQSSVQNPSVDPSGHLEMLSIVQNQSVTENEKKKWPDEVLSMGEMNVSQAGVTLVANRKTTERNRAVLVILELTGCGFLGIDRMYIGDTTNILLGIFKLITCGGCGIWGLVDYIIVAVNAVSKSSYIDVFFFDCTFNDSNMDVAYWLGLSALLVLGVIFACLLGCCFCTGFCTGIRKRMDRRRGIQNH